jgi:hypothetical protein
MQIRMTRWYAMAALVLPLSVAAQEHPRTDCEFDGFSATPKLAVTVVSSVAFYGCAAKPGCVSMKLEKGQPIVLFRRSADWICGYVENKGGAAPAWVAAAEVNELKPDPNPPVTAWLGTWINGHNSIQIKPTNQDSKLVLTGHATWHGVKDVEHSGDVDGEVTPNGNHIHYSEGPDACTIDLTLLGNYIVADDNNRCGGMNVRFWGIWKRTRK